MSAPLGLPRHIHVLGVCGYAVSGAALIAKQLGCLVTGSDEATYPPVPDIVTAAGIDWQDGYSAANLTRRGRPDLVVVANGVRPDNPEWVAARQLGVPVRSEMEVFADLTRDRRRVAVCGTHGKTTTASLLVHMLDRCGMDPGFRLGSTSIDLGATARLGTGPFIFEGDEYTTAAWDPRPKFLLIHPAAACVTTLELDHPDVYPDLESYLVPFRQLAAGMPRDGRLVLGGDDDECRRLAEAASSPVTLYGEAADSEWLVSDIQIRDGLQRFRLRGPGRREWEVALPFPGRHNAHNTAAALALADFLGAPVDGCVAACADFRGAGRRFQLAGEAAGVVVIDDYAHHPTEVEVTIAAARQRFPGRRVVAVHTPHTYSRTRALLDDYGGSFAGADVVVLGPVDAARERGLPVTVTNTDVARRVREGGGPEVLLAGSSHDALATLVAITRPGDVVLVLSLVGFDKIASRLVAALRDHAPRTGTSADGGGAVAGAGRHEPPAG